VELDPESSKPASECSVEVMEGWVGVTGGMCVEWAGRGSTGRAGEGDTGLVEDGKGRSGLGLGEV
jgi:hypothetical protein